MLVLAMSLKDHEFIYKAETARKVSKASADKICDIVNQYKFLHNCYPGYVWHIHEIDSYCKAYDYAQFQDFTIRKGIVKARNW